MCGRGACISSVERCRRVAGRTRDHVRGATRLRKKYNLGPQNYVPVVRHVPASVDIRGANADPSCSREVCAMRWGLVPSFAKRAEDFDVFKGGSSTFNARVESAESSNLWRRLLDSNRAVVIFDGFYEWKTTARGKTPMFIRNSDDYMGFTIPTEASQHAEQPLPPDLKDCLDGPTHAPLLLAALFDSWREVGHEKQCDEEAALETVTILTMDPDGTRMMDVHDRMPVFLTPETAALWLDPASSWKQIIPQVLRASQAHAKSQLLLYEVAPLVSNIRNESADCVLPKKEYDARQFSKGIGRFFQKKSADDINPKKNVEGGVNTECQETSVQDPEKKRLFLRVDGSHEEEKRASKVIKID